MSDFEKNKKRRKFRSEFTSKKTKNKNVTNLGGVFYDEIGAFRKAT